MNTPANDSYRRRPGRLSCAAVLLCCAVASADDREPARGHARRAFAAIGLNQYDVAASEYEQAFALRPDSALLFDAAQSWRLAGNKPRALELYRNYVRLFPHSGKKETAQRMITYCEAALAYEQQVAAATPTAEPSNAAPHEPALAQATATAEVAPAPTAPSPASNPLVDPPVERTPLRKRKWLWGVVGGGAALVIGAVVVGVVVALPKSGPVAALGAVKVN